MRTTAQGRGWVWVERPAIEKLLEFVSIESEVDLIQHYGLGALAGSFEHEVGTVLAQQAGGVIDQVTLLGQRP
jgi:hypothetical protein